MRWLGLTGGIATGKSTVAKILRDLSLPVVDADELARRAVAPGSAGLKQVVSEFGKDILDADGNMNRARLGSIVFADKEKLKKLEGIVHPIVQNLKNDERLRLESTGCPVAFYDVPLLFEKGLESDFDAIVVVYCPEDQQKSRIRQRDKLSEKEIENRLRAQISIEEKKRLADFVILNTGSLADLKSQVEKFVQAISTE